MPMSRRLTFALALEESLNRDLAMRCIQSYASTIGLRWVRVVRKIVHRGDQISIKVISQDGNEKGFKMRTKQEMEVLIDAISRRFWHPHVMALENFRLCFDGYRIHDHDTPDSLEMEDGDHIDVMVAQDIGTFGQHAGTAGRGYLDGSLVGVEQAAVASSPGLALQLQEAAAALSDEISSGPPGIYVSIPTPLLNGSARAALIAMADGACDGRVDFDGRADFQLPLARAQLEEIIGCSALLRLESCFFATHGLPSDGIPCSRYRLRRTAATASGEVINFHSDVTARTMQVPLNAESDYAGGSVLYATPTGLSHAPRRPGTATIHGADVVHGVTALTRGVRYALFLLSARTE